VGDTGPGHGGADHPGEAESQRATRNDYNQILNHLPLPIPWSCHLTEGLGMSLERP
jgi:hypothetical protein